MKRRVLIGLGALVGGYVALCALLFFQQGALLYPGAGQREVPPSPHRVAVPGGTFFEGQGLEGAAPLIVHFHGNGESAASLKWLAEEFRMRGLGFVAVEYPGYPGASGEPSETANLAAARAALEHLTTSLHVDRARLVLEGQSLGTGVATRLASEGWGRRLVLLSPYTAIVDVAAGAFPWVPVRALMRDRYDSLSVAPAVKQPVFIVHGRRDEVVPFALGETISKAFARVEFVPVDDAGHNDLWRDTVLDRVAAFVQKTD
ncbi:MAG: alpha/beta hydrolase [Myxococcaceae bacterium]